MSRKFWIVLFSRSQILGGDLLVLLCRGRGGGSQGAILVHVIYAISHPIYISKSKYIKSIEIFPNALIWPWFVYIDNLYSSITPMAQSYG